MTIHPAKLVDLSDLVASFEVEVAEGFIQTQELILSSERSLKLFNYSKRCQFERRWNPATVLARGLVIEFNNGVPTKLVALPFPKFFNAGEAEGAGAVDFNSAFEAFEKMDGSLGIIFCVDGLWRVATRGSFGSDQAVWATNWLRCQDGLLSQLDPDVTYLAEVIYPENRIVIRYDFEGLVLLGGYRVSSGEELDYLNDLLPLSQVTGLRLAQRYTFGSLPDAVQYVQGLESNREGFVIRFASSGARIKLKGAEYCALHKMISNITPLAIWELVSRSYDFDSYKASMPEEFWGDIDEMAAWFVSSRDELVQQVKDRAESYAHLSHKELGLLLGSKQQDRIDRMVFPYRRKGLDGLLPLVYDAIRPTGNVIPGYVPSSSMTRIQESAE